MYELRVAWGYARRVRVVRGRVAHPGRAPAAVAYRPEAAPRSHLGRSVRVALGSSFPEARAECPEAHTSKKHPHRRRRRDIARATRSRRTRVSRGDVSPPGCRETKLAKLDRRGTTNHELRLTRARAEDACASLGNHGRRHHRHQRPHAPRRAGVGDVPAPHQVPAEAERNPRPGAYVSVRPHRNRGGAEETHRRYATPAPTSRRALSRTSRT